MVPIHFFHSFFGHVGDSHRLRRHGQTLRFSYCFHQQDETMCVCLQVPLAWRADGRVATSLYVSRLEG